MVVIQHRAQDCLDIPVRWGVEIDVRDDRGEVILGHDPVNPFKQPHYILDFWLKEDIQKGIRPAYAVNVKCDGIERRLMDSFEAYPEICSRTFFFDMSYPSYMRFQELGARCAERMSERERVLDDPSNPRWVDRWNWGPDNWYPGLARGTEYAVSPELHVKDCPMEAIDRDWETHV